MLSPTDILHGKILIVDDQAVNILLLERMLGDAGYLSISSTQEPEQVCALHAKNRYDLILLDLQMPGMDGFQVMEALKALEPDGYLPVLVITAQPAYKIRALQVGARDFISKPFELAEVLQRAHNLLEVRLLHKKLRSYNDLLEQRVREQTTLLAISHTLASTLEFQPGQILDQLHELIPFTHGALFTAHDCDLVSQAVRAAPGQEPPAPILVHLNATENLIALFNRHQPMIIADVNSPDPQAVLLRSLLEQASLSLPAQGLQSAMWVPLAVKGRLLGGIALTESTRNYFTAHHAELALSVADQSALTLLNLELVGQAQAVAVLEERQRLSQDLHDAVNQSLFSAGLIVEVLPRLWDRDPEAARQSLNDLRRLTRGAMAEMRALLSELRPSTLIESDLGDLLRQLGNALSGRINLPVAITISGEFILPAEVQIVFYRVCQEALNNIAKHAHASQVEITLARIGNEVIMHIEDDGQGFNPARSFSGHFGLSMIRERIEAVGAQLSLTSQPGQGTRIEMSWTQPLAVESLPAALLATMPAA